MGKAGAKTLISFRLESVRLRQASFKTRAALVGAMFACLGVGGFFALKALADHTQNDLACTAIGCTSGIYANVGDARRTFHRAASVSFCVDGACKSVPVRAANVVGREWPAARLNTHTVYTVDLFIRDRAGRTLMHTRAAVSLHKSEPNGHDCGPTCFSASLQLQARRRRLHVYQS